LPNCCCSCLAAVVSCSSRVSVSARLPRRSDDRRKTEHGTPLPFRAVAVLLRRRRTAPCGVAIALLRGSAIVRAIDPRLEGRPLRRVGRSVTRIIRREALHSLQSRRVIHPRLDGAPVGRDSRSVSVDHSAGGIAPPGLVSVAGRSPAARHATRRTCVTRNNSVDRRTDGGYARTSLRALRAVPTRVACERAVRERSGRTPPRTRRARWLTSRERRSSRAHHTPLRGGALGVVLEGDAGERLRFSAGATASTARSVKAALRAHAVTL
jgi:hypothetical protein